MPAKLVIRVFPDDRVQVKVENLRETAPSAKKDERLCRKITKRLEDDLGLVEDRKYEGNQQQEGSFFEDEQLRQGNS